MKGKGEKEKAGGGRKGLKFPDEKCLPPSPRRAVPTNWKREESKDRSAAASARPAPGRRSQTAQTAATAAGPERRPRCGTSLRLPGAAWAGVRGSQAAFPLSPPQPTRRPPPRWEHAGRGQPGPPALRLSCGGAPGQSRERGRGAPRVVRDGAERFLKS